MAAHLCRCSPDACVRLPELVALDLHAGLVALQLDPLQLLRDHPSFYVTPDAPSEHALVQLCVDFDALETLLDAYTDRVAALLQQLGGGTVALARIEEELRKPAGLLETLDTRFVLESDVHDRFVLSLGDGGDVLVSLKTLEDSLNDWRELVFAFLQPCASAVPLATIGCSVPKPEYVPRSVKLRGVLTSDPQRRFALLRERGTVKAGLARGGAERIPHARIECAEDDQPDPLCVVCMAAHRRTLLLPCRHLLACSACAHRLSTCPACRHDISAKIDVYL